MPHGSKRGPAGFGPMTGRAAGFCSGYSELGYMNSTMGRAGFGFRQGAGGRGGGRGRRNMYYATGLAGWQRSASELAAADTSSPWYKVAPPFQANQLTPQQETEALKNQIKFMEDSIEKAQERIEQLEEKEQ